MEDINIEEANEALKQILDFESRFVMVGNVKYPKSELQKLIPEEPYLIYDGYADGNPVYEWYSCPNCDEEYDFDNEHYEYCPNCGQRLDW